MKAVVLAAGYGTRLRPLTDKTAKPLIDVGGRPIIDHIVDKVQVLSGIDQILVVCNQTFHSDFQSWQRARTANIPIRILNDGTISNETRRGAMGDVRFALEEIDDAPELLVVGGDNIFTFDLQHLVDCYRKNGNTIAVRDVASRDLAKLYGTVEMTPQGRVTGIVEKPSSPRTTMVSICIYTYGRSIRSRIEEYARVSDSMDTTGEFASWLCTVEPVYGCELKGIWFDIGDVKSLEVAREAFSTSGRGN